MISIHDKGIIRDLIIFLLISAGFFFIRYPLKMSDFEVYYLTGERVLNQENVYNLNDKLEFKYLPVTGIIFSAFTIVGSVEVAKILWYIINTLLIFTILIKSILLVNSKYDFRYFYGLFILFLFYLGRELILGQVNMLMLLLVLFSLEALLKKKEIKSGIFMGLSILIKPYTIIFLPYYLIKSKFKAFLSSLLILIFGILLPFLIYGFSAGKELYLSCFQLLNTTSNDLYTSIDNVSVWSLFAKYLQSLAFAKLLSLITIAGIYLIFLISAFREKELNEKNIIINYGVLLTLIPLFSPQGWFYQLTLGVLSILTILTQFKQISSIHKIFFILVLIIIPMSVSDISGKVVSRWIGNTSMLTWCFLFIFYLTIYLKASCNKSVISGKKSY